MSSFTLTIEPDPHDDVCRHSFEAHSRLFSGRSSCWASPTWLEELAAQLEAYPIPPDAPVSMRWGYGERLGDDVICKLEVRPADARGNLLVLAELGDSNDRSDRVRLRFFTHYTDIERFRIELMSMSSGRRRSAKLEGYGP